MGLDNVLEIGKVTTTKVSESFKIYLGFFRPSRAHFLGWIALQGVRKVLEYVNKLSVVVVDLYRPSEHFIVY